MIEEVVQTEEEAQSWLDEMLSFLPDEIVDALEDYAPVLVGAVAGPVAATIVGALIHVLDAEPTPEGIAEAIHTDIVTGKRGEAMTMVSKHLEHKIDK